MLTRSKRGICQKKCFLSITSHTSSLSDFPSCIEPYNYKSAMKIPEWKQAMQEEFDALQKQKTLHLVPLPPGKNLVPANGFSK